MGLLSGLFGGGSSGSTTTTTQVKLPPYANRALSSGQTMIADLYNQGNPPNYVRHDGGDTLAGFTPDQQAALSAMGLEGLGLSDLGTAGIGSAYDTLAGGYLGNYGGALGGDYDYTQAVGSGYSPSRAMGGGYDYAGAVGAYSPGRALGAFDANAGMSDYSPQRAMGSFDQGEFNNAVMALADPALRSASSQYSAAGRSGSGLAQEAKTDAIARSYAGLYDSERSRRANMYTAERAGRRGLYGQNRSILGNLYGSERAIRAGAYGDERDRRSGLYGNERALRGGMYGDERDRMMGLYGDERDRMLQSSALLPQFEALQHLPTDRLMRAGTLQQGQNQAALDDARARWESDANLPYQRVDDYLQRIQGVVPGGGYGETSQNTPTTGNPFMQSAGLGLGAFDILGGSSNAAIASAAPYLAGGLGVLSLLTNR